MHIVRSQVASALDQMAERLLPWPESGRLLVGVSGGADSLALLHILCQLYSAERLVVAHLNHGLRDSADEEAVFVEQTAAKWHVACYCSKVNVAELARRSRRSVEEAGREARYRFFANVASQLGAVATAVGHHADDQAETILMHLLRGTGLAGMRGMALIGPMPEPTERLLIRPLLYVNKEAIESYCLDHHLKPISDESNRDPSFQRNRLRHEIMPALSEYNPRFRRGLQQTSEIVAADYDYLEAALDQAWRDCLVESGRGWLSLDSSSWKSQSLSMRRGLLRRAVEQLRPGIRDIGFRPIELARRLAESADGGKRASLPGDLVLFVDYDQLVIGSRTEARPSDFPQLLEPGSLTIPVPGRVSLRNRWQIEASLVKEGLVRAETNQDQWQAYLDLGDQLLYIRPRQPGARLRPLGMGGNSTSIKKLMINRRIPARLRALWPIVHNSEHPVWLVGHQIDHRVRVGPESKRVILLRCYRLPTSGGINKPCP